MKLEDAFPKGEARVVTWNNWKDKVGAIDAWFGKDDVWIMGDTPCFADFILAAFILSAKTLFGIDSPEYKDVLTMHGGRWGRLAKNVEKYEGGVSREAKPRKLEPASGPASGPA